MSGDPHQPGDVRVPRSETRPSLFGDGRRERKLDRCVFVCMTTCCINAFYWVLFSWVTGLLFMVVAAFGGLWGVLAWRVSRGSRTAAAIVSLWGVLTCVFVVWAAFFHDTDRSGGSAPPALVAIHVVAYALVLVAAAAAAPIVVFGAGSRDRDRIP